MKEEGAVSLSEAFRRDGAGPRGCSSLPSVKKRDFPRECVRFPSKLHTLLLYP